MTDSVLSPAAGSTAGALLRAAREKQGLHISALAAATKVPVAKLEALEADRYDALPDPAFTRALAQAICRALKIDPQPILALLPQSDPSALDHVVGTLNTPFRERAVRSDGPRALSLSSVRPMVWAGGALLVAAAVLFFLPASVWERAPGAVSAGDGGADPVAPLPVAAEPVPVEPPLAGVDAPASEPASRVETAQAVPAQSPVAAVPASSGVAATASLVQLRADEASWVEAVDAAGRPVFSRLVQPGESVGLDGPLPLRLKIGNAPATRLVFRGQPVDLAPLTRNAVARVELQ